MSAGEWVLLAYRVPREPSTPRIAIWRNLKRLGVAQLGDGLVGLPADARTRESLEWIADDVQAAGGTATVWLARPASVVHERELAAQMAAARAAEYETVTAQAQAAISLAGKGRTPTVGRRRADLQATGRGAFSPPRQREAAQRAVRDLAAGVPVRPGLAGGGS
ncbi:chromate resistance protein [Micromonospora sp. CPCC 205371]|nr:chromate resistance protein [Micromonospora sp. CPCC 205371]